MQLTAILEEWILEDGNYPGLYRGKLVNLSFELLGVEEITKTTEDCPDEFVHLGNAEYQFCGEILKIYDNDFLNEGGFAMCCVHEDALQSVEGFGEEGFDVEGYIQQLIDEHPTKLVIISANGFRFYLYGSHPQDCNVGDRVAGQGRLSIDHYIWVENLEKYQDPPNLFYTLQVKEIRQVNIPEQFLGRDEDGRISSSPTWISAEEYTDSDIKVVESMFEKHEGKVFYVIDFDSEGVEHETVKRTFLGNDF